jgi:hypothetical protein
MTAVRPVLASGASWTPTHVGENGHASVSENNEK